MAHPEGMSKAIAMPKVSAPSREAGLPVLIIHSWWGLTSSFAVLADRLAEAGFVAGCVDLYAGRVAATEHQARALRGASRHEPMYRTLQRALVELGAHPQASGPDPAVLGFSMGGHWAIWLAQHPPPSVSAVVLYYAARSGDFTNMTSPVLAHFAETDEFVSHAAQRKMASELARRRLGCTIYGYPGTHHWFAEADHPAYDATAAGIAFDRTVEFLRSIGNC
jgi:carboxymethylenebutenolidase